VVVVENRGAPATDFGGWSIDTAPALIIGSAGGEDAYQFWGVAGAHRLSYGRIGVVNAGSREVRFFRPDGTYLLTVGRRGSGPGEFESPALAGTVGDTLVVVDRAHHRLTYVHPDIGLVRMVRVSDDVGGFLNPAGVFSNGQVVFGGAFDMRKIGELHNGMNRAHTFYRSSHPDGSLATDFGDQAGAEFFIRDLEGGGQDARPAVIPFGKVPTATASPSHFYFSDQDEWEIQVYEPSGTLVRLIRWDWDPIPVTPADGALHIENVVSQVGDPAQEVQIRQYLGSLPLPDFFPPFGEFLSDPAGFLWVAEFQRPELSARKWTIFDAQGALVARITLPERFNPLEIGMDYVLGVGWDEMNVESIRLFPLTRVPEG